MEKILVAYNGLPKSHRSALSPSENKIWSRVMDPRAYSWEVKTKQADLWHLLLDSIVSSQKTDLFEKSDRTMAAQQRVESF